MAGEIQLKKIIRAIHGSCAQTKLYLWKSFVFFPRNLMCKLSCSKASQIVPRPFVVCNVLCDFLPPYSIKQCVLV